MHCIKISPSTLWREKNPIRNTAQPECNMLSWIKVACKWKKYQHKGSWHNTLLLYASSSPLSSTWHKNLSKHNWHFRKYCSTSQTTNNIFFMFCNISAILLTFVKATLWIQCLPQFRPLQGTRQRLRAWISDLRFIAGCSSVQNIFFSSIKSTFTSVCS